MKIAVLNEFSQAPKNEIEMCIRDRAGDENGYEVEGRYVDSLHVPVHPAILDLGAGLDELF